MRRAIVAALAVMVPLHGCAGPREDRTSPAEVAIDVGAVTPAVQGGVPVRTDPYSVALCTGESPTSCVFRCSGTLVAKNLVLTVRHCLYPAPSKSVDCANDLFTTTPYVAAFNVWVTTSGGLAPVSTPWHRGLAIEAPSARAVCGSDIAAVFLEDAVPAAEATPASPSLAPLSGATGPIASIGYGESAPGLNDYGTRRMISNVPITCLSDDPLRSCAAQLNLSFTPREFIVKGGQCPGDSGSGAFDQGYLNLVDEGHPSGQGVLLGVLARASIANGQCIDGVYTRLDTWSSFVAGAGLLAARLGAYPPPAWANVSDAAQLETPEPYAARALGAKCVSDADCDSQTCASEDKGFTFRCTQGCGEVDVCPTGFVCKPFQQDVQRCFPALATAQETPGAPASSGSCNLTPRSGGLDRMALFCVIALGAAARFRRHRHRSCA